MRRLDRHPLSFLLATAAGAAAGCDTPARVTQPTPGLALARGGEPGRSPLYDITIVTQTLGGPRSRANAINARGWLAGFSLLPDGSRHAALWRGSPQGGAVTDLGTLGGASSSVAWPGLNDPGVAVGIAQTNMPDPLDESWSCAAFLGPTPNTCLGFVWRDGVMTALPTLGGNNGYAAGVNDRGQVVGWAETVVEDPTCSRADGQVLQFRAVRWEPGRRWRPVEATELRPLPGDSASAAVAINDAGEVVGISGDCDQAVGRFTARHAVRWDARGRVSALPTLGGASWHTPTAVNARGDAVGFSNPRDPRDAAGEFIARAVLWPRRGGIVEVGRLPGDSTSQAQGVNNRGQVVGVSVAESGTSRAFLWEDGALYDLNALVAGVAPRVLASARAVNDAGAITGDLLDPATGRSVPFVATPRGGRR